MAEAKKTNDIAAMSFEDALQELEGIVRSLEKGDGKLDESIAAYARGAELKAHCQKKLEEARAKVEKIQVGPGGTVGTEPVDSE